MVQDPLVTIWKKKTKKNKKNCNQILLHTIQKNQILVGLQTFRQNSKIFEENVGEYL